MVRRMDALGLWDRRGDECTTGGCLTWDITHIGIEQISGFHVFMDLRGLSLSSYFFLVSFLAPQKICDPESWRLFLLDSSIAAVISWIRAVDLERLGRDSSVERSN